MTTRGKGDDCLTEERACVHELIKCIREFRETDGDCFCFDEARCVWCKIQDAENAYLAAVERS